MRITRLLILALSFLASCPALAFEGRKVVHRAEPTYPEIARRIHMMGRVQVQVTVDSTGNVKDAKLLSGNSMLGNAALSAAKSFKYEPGEESTTQITFDFH
jgi:TonB family protein